MNDINSCILIGRLTRDGELAYTQNGKAVLKISLAVNRSVRQGEQWADDTAFFDVTCWGIMAEGLKQRIGKGSLVGVVGRLCQDRWQDKQTGQNRTKIYILAETVEVLKGLQKDGQSHYGNPQNQQDYSQDYQQGEMNYGG
jgi:single-strand DNA-binding protein